MNYKEQCYSQVCLLFDEVYSLPFVITPSLFLAFQMMFSEHHLYSRYSY